MLSWVPAALAVIAGVGMGWLVIRGADATYPSGLDNRGTRLPRRWSLTEKALWLIGWLMVVAFSKVPASSIHIMVVIGVLGFVCICGGLVLRGVWTLLHTFWEGRSHRQRASES